MTTGITLGSWLKQYREQHNISQPELADTIGIEQSYLSKLENDKSLPSADILDAIINATQTTLDKLVVGLDKSYVYNQLAKLPQVKSFLANQQQHTVQQSNRRLFMFGLMMCLGCFFFYLGYGQIMSSNIHYQYTSDGILNEGEPLKAFDKSLHHEIRMSLEEYNKRFNPKSLVMDSKKMPAFVSNSNGEKRYYRLADRFHEESSFNAGVKALGILLLSGGFFGLVLMIINRKVLRPS